MSITGRVAIICAQEDALAQILQTAISASITLSLMIDICVSARLTGQVMIVIYIEESVTLGVMVALDQILDHASNVFLMLIGT